MYIRVYSYYICTLPDYVNFHRRVTQNGTFCHYLRDQWKKRCERNRREAEKEQKRTKEDDDGHKDNKKEETDQLLRANQKKTSDSQGDDTDGGEKEGKEAENIKMVDITNQGAIEVKEGTT